MKFSIKNFLIFYAVLLKFRNSYFQKHLTLATYETTGLYLLKINTLSAIPQNGQTHTKNSFLPTNCMSVFDHFVWLALKRLK